MMNPSLFQLFILLLEALNLLLNHHFEDLRPSNLIEKEILPIKTASLFVQIDSTGQPEAIFSKTRDMRQD